MTATTEADSTIALDDGVAGNVIDVLIRHDGTGAASTPDDHLHSQPVASTTWTVSRNFGQTAESVAVFVDDGMDQVPSHTAWLRAGRLDQTDLR